MGAGIAHLDLTTLSSLRADRTFKTVFVTLVPCPGPMRGTVLPPLAGASPAGGGVFSEYYMYLPSCYGSRKRKAACCLVLAV